MYDPDKPPKVVRYAMAMGYKICCFGMAFALNMVTWNIGAAFLPLDRGLGPTWKTTSRPVILRNTLEEIPWSC